MELENGHTENTKLITPARASGPKSDLRVPELKMFKTKINDFQKSNSGHQVWKVLTL
jgi:hypothetical protein